MVETNEKNILQSKPYLYLTEFFAGMSVMAVELGASRLLAPYFSSSQIVWTIIIGTIMIAMALGNVYGGKTADKNPDPSRLYLRMIIAAVWIAAIPVVGKYIIAGIAGVMILTINTNFLVVAAFAACLIIFVFPLFLLGTVTPSLVKYTTDSLKDNGRTVGILGAFNTIGSILGTFLPTFVTIPAVGTAISFLIFGGILLFLSILYFISGKVRSKAAVIGVILFVLCCIFGHNSSFAFWEKNLTAEDESVYNYLQVKEDDEKVVLSTNVLFGVQSVRMKTGDLTGMYYDYAMAAPFMAGVRDKDALDILILGNGTGTFATQCQRYFGKDLGDELRIEAVEIDDKITGLAKEYFALSPDVKVTTYDGRAYLAALDGKYDVIMVDAYQDITIPFQMSSREFFSMVSDHLRDDGIMVVNMNMRGSVPGSINDYLSDTIGTVFPYIYTADVSYSTNRELFAAKDEKVLSRFSENRKKEPDQRLAAMMEVVSDSLQPYEPGDYLLTDDKAPVELLGMQVIDELIADEVSFYRSVYQERGVEGLLDML